MGPPCASWPRCRKQPFACSSSSRCAHLQLPRQKAFLMYAQCLLNTMREFLQQLQAIEACCWTCRRIWKQQQRRRRQLNLALLRWKQTEISYSRCNAHLPHLRCALLFLTTCRPQDTDVAECSVCDTACCTLRPEHSIVSTAFLVMQKLDHATEQVETALQKERQLTSHHTQVYCCPPARDLSANMPLSVHCKMLSLPNWGL